MTDLKALGQKILEWAVIAALVGVIGYLVGNSEAATMRAEIDHLKRELARHQMLLNGRRIFNTKAVGPVNYLCEKDPGCRSRYPALEAPE